MSRRERKDTARPVLPSTRGAPATGRACVCALAACSPPASLSPPPSLPPPAIHIHQHPHSSAPPLTSSRTRAAPRGAHAGWNRTTTEPLSGVAPPLPFSPCPQGSARQAASVDPNLEAACGTWQQALSAGPARVLSTRPAWQTGRQAGRQKHAQQDKGDREFEFDIERGIVRLGCQRLDLDFDSLLGSVHLLAFLLPRARRRKRLCHTTVRRQIQAPS
jgi:hypothetical protein